MKKYNELLNQSDEDLKAARNSEIKNNFEWACFQSQQSAVNSLRALLLYLHFDSWGHGLINLLEKLKEKIEESEKASNKIFLMNEYNNLKEKCQELDMHYMEPRDPDKTGNGDSEGYYDKNIALKCIEYAEEINTYVKDKIAILTSSE